MTNEQRMVDVELLREVLFCAALPYGTMRKLRAIISGPGVEPVAYALWMQGEAVPRQLFLTLPASKQAENRWLAAYEGCRHVPLYLAAPSAPVPSDDQGPFDKSRLKRLVTQVFGEGWHIIPPSAPAHNETAELCAWRSRFPQFEYRHQDECVALRAGSDKPAAPVQAVPDWQPIETAPKDGGLILVGNETGVWVACYDAIFPSCYKPSNPWRSMLLYHDHIRRNHSLDPTHWMPLPQPPKESTAQSVACPTKDA